METDWLKYEKEARQKGYLSVCGVDEAGRGPLAGPVCAAAVILNDNKIIEGVNDSKKLSEKKREELFNKIISESAAYSVAFASVEEIEELNILNATMLAMKRAVEGLSIKADYAMIDGNKTPDLNIPCEAIVRGDANSMSIAAASILAKVSRDRLCYEYAEKYPQYMFDKHKGYGTKLHIEMLKKYGPCEIHRPSFLRKILKLIMNTTFQKAKGNAGEDFTAKYLTDRGYTILQRNFSCKSGEIDIIARNRQYVIFVEVKTRGAHSIASPVEYVDYNKQKRIFKTAFYYLSRYPLELQPRFDIAEVYMDDAHSNRPRINYIENAFMQEGDYAVF